MKTLPPYRRGDVARLAGVSEKTVDGWHRSGKLPETLPLPGRPRWARESIDALLRPPAPKKAPERA